MICDTIKKLREDSGYSQSALAKKLGITRSSVNAWEMGLSIPTARYIIKLAQTFCVSTDYLLGLDRSETLYIDHLSVKERQLLYSLVNYFEQK